MIFGYADLKSSGHSVIVPFSCTSTSQKSLGFVNGARQYWNILSFVNIHSMEKTEMTLSAAADIFIM